MKQPHEERRRRGEVAEKPRARPPRLPTRWVFGAQWLRALSKRDREVAGRGSGTPAGPAPGSLAPGEIMGPWDQPDTGQGFSCFSLWG